MVDRLSGWRSIQHWLKLLTAQSGIDSLRQLCKIRNEGTRLFECAVLSKGDKIVSAAGSEAHRDSRVAGQPIVGRYGDDHGAFIPQMCLCRQCDRPVGNAGCQFGERISCARHDNEHIQKFFWPEGLCFFYGMDNLTAAQRFQPFPELRRRAKAGCLFQS